MDRLEQEIISRGVAIASQAAREVPTQGSIGRSVDETVKVWAGSPEPDLYVCAGEVVSAVARSIRGASAADALEQTSKLCDDAANINRRGATLDWIRRLARRSGQAAFPGCSGQAREP